MQEHQAHERHSGQGDMGGHDGHGMRGSGRMSHRAHTVADFRRRFWVSLVLSVPVVALAPLVQELLGLRQALRFPGGGYVQFVFAAAVYVYGGWPFLKGMAAELRRREPGMMTLIGLAISVAFVYSSAVVFGLRGEVFFWELATLVVIMLLGHWIEMKSIMGASRALELLVELMPATAHRLTDGGGTEDIPLQELRAGDRVLVKPGEKVPIDGEIVEGRTSVNEAMLTGESRPVEKGAGDPVIGGSVNGETAFTVEVRKTGEETYLAQVIRMVGQAQESRSHTQDLANRAALWLTVIALGAGGVTLAFWLLAGQVFAFALERMVTVMVIACPHALGLAVPLVVAVSTAISARNGLLIRDRSAFERARRVDAIIFDKTGTLTEGRFGVTDVIALGERAERDVLRLAASLESSSEHPIARGIVDRARIEGIEIAAPQEFKAIPGQGAEATIDGLDVKVVSPGYLGEHGLDGSGERSREAAAAGQTVVYLVVEGALDGALALADVVRPESGEALARLKKMGIRTMMLTGDAEAVAKSVAGELGLDEYFAEVRPDQKAERVKAVQRRGLVVAMVGDGVNDAPALAQADVGIAIGAGTDIAIEAADIVLVRSDPRDVTAIVHLARATYGKMIQNLLWATGYNVVAIPLAAGVLYRAGILLSPAAGAALMAVSTVIVAVNARLLRVRREPIASRQATRGEAS